MSSEIEKKKYLVMAAKAFGTSETALFVRVYIDESELRKPTVFYTGDGNA